MQYVLTVSDPRWVAGITRQLDAYNNAPTTRDPLTAEQYLSVMLPLKDWADLHAPASIPTGQWLSRWTPAEQSAALSLAAQNDAVKALWLKLLSSEHVELDNSDLAAGVPLVCGALQQMGVIADAAARAAEIMAY